MCTYMYFISTVPCIELCKFANYSFLALNVTNFVRIFLCLVLSSNCNINVLFVAENIVSELFIFENTDIKK